MSDYKEHACPDCGSLLHYDARCVRADRDRLRDANQLLQDTINTMREQADLGRGDPKVDPLAADLATARARLAAVEALPERWRTDSSFFEGKRQYGAAGAYYRCARELQEALAGPRGEGEQQTSGTEFPGYSDGSASRNLTTSEAAPGRQPEEPGSSTPAAPSGRLEVCPRCSVGDVCITHAKAGRADGEGEPAVVAIEQAREAIRIVAGVNEEYKQRVRAEKAEAQLATAQQARRKDHDEFYEACMKRSEDWSKIERALQKQATEWHDVATNAIIERDAALACLKELREAEAAYGENGTHKAWERREAARRAADELVKR